MGLKVLGKRDLARKDACGPRKLRSDEAELRRRAGAGKEAIPSPGRRCEKMESCMPNLSVVGVSAVGSLDSFTASVATASNGTYCRTEFTNVDP